MGFLGVVLIMLSFSAAYKTIIAFFIFLKRLAKIPL